MDDRLRTTRTVIATLAGVVAGTNTAWWGRNTSAHLPCVHGSPHYSRDDRLAFLQCRVGNVGDPNAPLTILLHGLIATGDIFGADFDQLATTGPLVVPDLLGFGQSLDETLSSFGPEAHLDALDKSLDDLDLTDRPIRIGAHSIGSAVALRWLERRPNQITSITCFGRPIYQNADAVDATIAELGLMA